MISYIKTSIYVFIFLNMAGIGWSATIPSGVQEPVSRQFLILHDAGLQIFSDSLSNSTLLSDYAKTGLLQDTLEIIAASQNFYHVRYFSIKSVPEEGYIFKGKDQKVFKVNPVYSLARQEIQRTNMPSKEDRLKMVSSHTEWGVLFRYMLAEGYVASGMDAGMVKSCYGEPDERLRFFTSLLDADQWTYYLAPGKDFRITFAEGKLVLFEDRTLHSWIAAERKQIEDKKTFFYPHRLLGMKVMVAGGISLVVGYNGLKHQSILSTADAGAGNPRVVSANNALNWVFIGLGFAAETLGGYLFNYSPDIKLLITQPTARSSGPPMAGISISLR